MESFWRADIDPDHEPHRVFIKRDVLTDPARGNRAVPIKVYYPVAHSLSHLPVILWSHGLGGSAEGAAFLGRYIASHGYVVVNTQHAGTDSGLWEGKPGHPWDVIRATPIPRQAAIDRFRDIPFVLDSLPVWAAAHPDIAGHMDLSRLGMSGHSFGALTTQMMAGQGYPTPAGTLEYFTDKRFHAGILYSPVPVHYMTDLPDSEIYGTITLPLLHITGTADESPVEGFGWEKRRAVFEHSRGTPRHLVILEDGDHMVFAGSRGKLAEHPKRKTHEFLIKTMALAFWDAFLKDDAAAQAWLREMGGWLGAEGAHTCL